MKRKLMIFLTAFAQVALVAANTRFIASDNVTAIAATSFTLNMVWTFNIKKMAFGTDADRITYAVGACLGCLAGYFAAKMIL